MKALVVEAIGTLFLVLVIGLTTIAPGAGTLAPLAIGAILMVMVYAGGPVSGAHYNPAVTLAVWLRGKIAAKDAFGYLCAQLLGAILAAGLIGWFKTGSAVAPLQPSLARAFAAEMLFTFALAYVVLSVATAKAAAGNSYFGLAIGLTVMAGAYAVGGISGGVFNPAVATGLTVLGIATMPLLVFYVLAECFGAGLAALVFKFVHPRE